MSDLEVRVTVGAPREAVWRDWTEAAALAAWFWPPRLDAQATISRETERWRIRSEVAGMGVNAKIRAWDEPRRLELLWRWDGEEPNTEVVVTLVPVDDGTEVTVTQGSFDRETDRDEHVQGWSDCLKRLVERHCA